jgi:hypothetical protein
MNTKNLTQQQRFAISLMERAKFKIASAIEAFSQLDEMGALSADLFSTKKILEDTVDRIEIEQSDIWNQV